MSFNIRKIEDDSQKKSGVTVIKTSAGPIASKQTKNTNTAQTRSGKSREDYDSSVRERRDQIRNRNPNTAQARSGKSRDDYDSSARDHYQKANYYQAPSQRGGGTKRSEPKGRGFWPRFADATIGGAKGSVASDVNAATNLYQQGQNARDFHNQEFIDENQHGLDRARHDLAVMLEDNRDTPGLWDQKSIQQQQNIVAEWQRKVDAMSKVKNEHVQEKATAESYKAADAVQDSAAQDIARAKAGLNGAGGMLVDAWASTVQSGLDLAGNAALGTPQNMIPFGFRAYGGATQAARREQEQQRARDEAAAALTGQTLAPLTQQEKDKQLRQQTAYGLASAAKEIFTEKMFGLSLPGRVAYGKGGIDNLVENGIEQAVNRFAKTETGRRILGGGLTYAAGAATEGLEELIGDWMEWQLPRIYGGEVQSAGQTAEDSLYDFLVGAASGAIGGTITPSTYYYGMDRESQTNRQNAAIDQAYQTMQDTGLFSPEANAQRAQTRQTVDRAGALTGSPSAAIDRAAQSRTETDRALLETARAAVADRTGRAPADADGQSQAEPVSGKNAIVDKADKVSGLADAVEQGRRVDVQSLSEAQIAEWDNHPDYWVDSSDRVYKMQPEQHISQRSSEALGDRKVNAFQYDHPEVQQYYKAAAEQLARDASLSIDAPKTGRMERTTEGKKYVQKILDTPSLRAAMNEGLSRNDVITAAEALAHDKGQENNAKSKRLELVLNRMLTDGYTTAEGERVDANGDYLRTVQQIPGYQAREREVLPIYDMGEAGENAVVPTVDAETVSARQASVRRSATVLGENGARALTAGYDTITAQDYTPEEIVQGFYPVYNAALNGTELTGEAAEQAATLPKHLRLAAESAGERDAARAAQAQYFGENAGLRRDALERKANLSSKTRRSLDALGKALGVEIRFAEAVAGGAANAQYENGVITLALDADDPVLTSAVHEAVHRVREAAPNAYQELAEFVQKSMNEDTEQADLDHRAALYQTDNVDALTEELVADAFGRMVGNEELLSQLAADHPTVLQKIADVFHDAAAAIRRALNKQNLNLSAEQKAEFQDLEGLVNAMNRKFRNALKATTDQAEQGNAAQTDGEAKLSINERFAKELREWAENEQPAGERFILGSTGPILQGLGAIESDIYMNGDKINTILNEHPEMTIREIQRIPEVLENPTLILKSRNAGRNRKSNTRMVLFGSLKGQDGRPVLCALDLRPTERGFALNDMQKVTSAYTKDNNPVKFVMSSDVLYADKKRTTRLLSEIGFQMPISCNRSGYIGSVAYSKDSVKLTGVPFSSAFDLGSGAGEAKFSLKEYTDEEKKQHIKDAISYFGRTYKWAETGYITADGKRLDFSGRHEGGPSGYRTVDHRDISDALGDDYGGDDYSGSMVQFMSEGNIRISPESGGINLSVMPTKAQLDTLSDFISKQRGEVILDLDTVDGNTVSSTEYPRGTHANKVLGDIKAYFENGSTPHVSELAQFRYSLKDKEALAEYVKKYGAIPKGEKAARFVEMPKQTGDGKYLSQTVRTILEAKATPDEMVPNIEALAAKGDFSYDRYTDKDAIADAEKQINHLGWAQALTEWNERMKSGEVSKANTAMGWALYNNAANSGDTKTALTVLEQMVAHQRSAAQALQATRILKNMAPKTQLYMAQKSVENLQEELNKRFKDGKGPTLEIDKALAEEYLAAQNQEQRDEALKNIYLDIGRQMPSTFRDRWNAWRYLAMLGNPRTHVRNIMGNLFFAPVVAAKDLTATGIESLVYRASGGRMQRSKALVLGSKQGRALLKAAFGDYAKIKDAAMGGGKYSDFANANRYIEEGRKIFGNTKSKLWNKTGGALLEAARKGNGIALDAEDAWFSQPHYAYALAQFCKAHNISAEEVQSGKGIKAAREYAILEAQKATYRDTNALSQTISELGRVNKGSKNLVKKGVATLMEGILPFRKTPANILARGLEYSPLGLMNGIKQATYDVRNGTKTAAEAIDTLSAGMTGTVLVAFGAYLAAQGLVRGHGGDDDDKRELEELMGHQAYAMELPDGTSATLDWMAPEALPFFIGVNLWENTQGEKDALTLSSVLDSVSTISEPLLEMSCLQSLNDVFDSVSNVSNGGLEGLPAALASAATSYLTQALPTVLGQAERTGEDKRYTTFAEKNAFLTTDMQYTIGKASAKIPGWDYQQIPYIDAWGRTEPSGNTAARAFNNFVNPAYTSRVQTSATEEELLRLHESTGETAIFPSRAEKKITVNGEEKQLTADEYVTYAVAKGQESRRLLDNLVKSKEYKAMSDADKVAAIKNIYDLAAQKAKQKVSDYTPQSWVEHAEEAEKKYGISPETYAALKTKTAGIEGIKDKDGETITNSKGLQIMEVIYNTPGLNDRQREAMAEYLGVGKKVRKLNKAAVAEKLKKMR